MPSCVRAESPAEAAQCSQQGLLELFISLPVVQRQQRLGFQLLLALSTPGGPGSSSRSHHHPGLAEPSLAPGSAGELPPAQLPELLLGKHFPFESCAYLKFLRPRRCPERTGAPADCSAQLSTELASSSTCKSLGPLLPPGSSLEQTHFQTKPLPWPQVRASPMDGHIQAALGLRTRHLEVGQDPERESGEGRQQQRQGRRRKHR